MTKFNCYCRTCGPKSTAVQEGVHPLAAGGTYLVYHQNTTPPPACAGTTPEVNAENPNAAEEKAAGQERSRYETHSRVFQNDYYR